MDPSQQFEKEKAKINLPSLESGKASRKLCKSTKPDSELGASQLSSCISQGFRARDTEKKFTINRKRQKIKGKIKGAEAIKRNRIENENWKLARTFIEHFQMKKGYTSLTEISRELNLNGYRTRRGCSFSPEIVKRLIEK